MIKSEAVNRKLTGFTLFYYKFKTKTYCNSTLQYVNRHLPKIDFKIDLKLFA